MGVVMRTVPQVNIFAVGMPLKILLGLVVIFATMIVFRTLANSLISGVKTETNIFLEHIR
jgi:flagellar biosynthetic protein FliR